MLEFKSLDIEDKGLFDKYLKPYNFSTCEYSFTNLFIWRKGCDIQYTVYKDALIIKRKDFEGKYYFMQPVGYRDEDLKDIIDKMIELKDNYKLDFLLKDVELPFLDKLRTLYSDKLTEIEDRDGFNYIYESEKLSSLSGKKLHSKKNHYNNFIKNNTFRAVPITDEIIADCISFAKEWCKNSDSSEYILYELNGIEELLNNNENLNFVGMAVYVDNKLSAFTLGEKMNEDMAIIHIEKADADIQGLYAFINKTFVETYFSDVPYINREQDLGMEGLRKAKLSYHPFKMEPVFSVN